MGVRFGSILGPFWHRKSGQLKDRNIASGCSQKQTCASNEREAPWIIESRKPEATFANQYKPEAIFINLSL